MVYGSPQDHSALVATTTLRDGKLSQPKPGGKGGLVDRDRLKCDYCGGLRHDREHCWKLHGRPSRGRGTGG